MPENGESDEVADDELLYRRIPASKTDWYNPDNNPQPTPEAFRPHEDNDHDGISLTRAKSDKHSEFLNNKEAASGPSKKGYFVAVLRAGDLKNEDIRIVSDPIETEPVNLGHVVLPDLHSDNRKSDEAMRLKRVLADKLTLRVEGPFHVI